MGAQKPVYKPFDPTHIATEKRKLSPHNKPELDMNDFLFNLRQPITSKIKDPEKATSEELNRYNKTAIMKDKYAMLAFNVVRDYLEKNILHRQIRYDSGRGRYSETISLNEGQLKALQYEIHMLFKSEKGPIAREVEQELQSRLNISAGKTELYGLPVNELDTIVPKKTNK